MVFLEFGLLSLHAMWECNSSAVLLAELVLEFRKLRTFWQHLNTFLYICVEL